MCACVIKASGCVQNKISNPAATRGAQKGRKHQQQARSGSGGGSSGSTQGNTHPIRTNFQGGFLDKWELNTAVDAHETETINANARDYETYHPDNTFPIPPHPLRCVRGLPSPTPLAPSSVPRMQSTAAASLLRLGTGGRHQVAGLGLGGPEEVG